MQGTGQGPQSTVCRKPSACERRQPGAAEHHPQAVWGNPRQCADRGSIPDRQPTVIGARSSFCRPLRQSGRLPAGAFLPADRQLKWYRGGVNRPSSSAVLKDCPETKACFGFAFCRRTGNPREGMGAFPRKREKKDEYTRDRADRSGLSGRCLCAVRTLAGKTWGIDPKAATPAHRLQDGKDYVPTDGWTVFSHQFSSIAGAGPVTGAIQAAAFGWAAGAAVDSRRRHLLRCCHRLRRPVRQCQE